MGSGGEGVFFGKNQETLLGDFAAYIGSRTLCQMEEVGEKDFKPPCQRKILSLVRLCFGSRAKFGTQSNCGLLF